MLGERDHVGALRRPSPATSPARSGAGRRVRADGRRQLPLGRYAERLATLVEVLDEARASHQAWIVDDVRRPPARPRRPLARRAVHALHAATDVYTWKLLRRDLHLSRTETEKTIADLVVGILEGTTR